MKIMNNNRIFIGPPGSGKTYAAKKAIVDLIWNHMSEDEKKRNDSRYYNPLNFSEKSFNYVTEHYTPGIRIVSLHDGMTVNDLIEGVTLVETDGSVKFKNQPQMVLRLLEEMDLNPYKPAFLLLDDVHRLNISGALGELLFAFSHREERVTLPSGRVLKIPENLYVLMTYNDLKPEYSLNIGLLGTFRITYMDSSAEKLKKAVIDSFYKSAYFNIEAQLIDNISDLKVQWNTLLRRYNTSDKDREEIQKVIRLFEQLPDFSVCFNEKTAKCFEKLSFPLTWEEQTTLKYKKQFNDITKLLYQSLNEIYELYSKYYTKQTLNMLQSFCMDVEWEYTYYNSFLDYIAPEYYEERKKYVIGYTYFLPGQGYSMWNAQKLLQNKIRSQVLPLLRQYKKEGIILCNSIPDIEHTFQQYTRERAEVEEEAITIKENCDYRKVFLESFTLRKSADSFRQQGGQKYNSNYGVLFELLSDMINHPLINNWEIMDILLYDREIYFKLDESQSWGSCLLCSSDLSKKVVLGSSDSTAGNNNGVYRSDLHAVFYKGKKYYMVSKIKTENRGRHLSIKSCRQTKSVRREIALYGMAKLLVYKYIQRYLANLCAYKDELLDSTEVSAIRIEINQIQKDLSTLDSMRLYGSNNDELRWNLLRDIKALPTWKGMISGNIRGAYKKMDNRYQSIMESTGIHQMILQGPPGTSKTYGVKEFLAQQANLVSETDGSWNEKDLNRRQLISRGDEYVLPTEGINETDNIFWDIIQFHPSYTYEDFVRGIAVSTSERNLTEITGKILEGETEKYAVKIKQPVSVAYKTVNRTLGKMARIAKEYYNCENPENSKKFYLVIDEINRANLATVFGELIYALEYRDSEVATPYAVHNEARLQIPNNLYIIGTMNTADKSISSIDYAIRRRFLFFPVLPDISVVYKCIEDDWKDSAEIKLFHIIERLFDVYLNTDDYSRSDIQIGHTYFLRRSSGKEAMLQMRDRFLFQVIPVLKEYYNDGIIVNETYGKEPQDFEFEALACVKRMTEVFDIDTLNKLYDHLLDELSKQEFIDSISKELEGKNIAAK